MDIYYCHSNYESGIKSRRQFIYLFIFFFSLNKKNTEIRNFKLYTYVYLGVMCIYLTFLGQGFDR